MDKTKTQKDIICPECGAGPFKTEQGLAGHRKIAHNIQLKTVEKDNLLERLEGIETQLASTINPGTVVDSEERVIDKLKLLLSAIEKYQLTVGNLGQRTGFGFISDPKYRIVRNSDLERSGIGGQCLKAKAKEL